MMMIAICMGIVVAESRWRSADGGADYARWTPSHLQSEQGRQRVQLGAIHGHGQQPAQDDHDSQPHQQRGPAAAGPGQQGSSQRAAC